MSGPDPRATAPAAVSGALAIVVLAALAMTASGLADHTVEPAAPVATVTQVPIQQRELVCPDLSTPGASVVEVSSAGAGGGSLLAGVDQMTDLPGKGGLATVKDQAGSGVRVAAGGAAAAGLLAIRHDTTSDTSASVDCVSPGASWWFAGGGASVAHRSFLLLRNLDPGDAALQLRVFTAQGEIEPVVDAQVVVPGSSQRRIDLSLLTSFKQELTISVVAERGLVAASMHDSISAEGASVAGQSWLGGLMSPERTLVFGVDRGGDKLDELVITNPSGQSANVGIEVASDNGWFAPQEVTSFALGAGQVTSVDLAGVLDGGVNAVRVVSTRPVVGILRRGLRTDMTEVEPLPELTVPAAVVVPDARAARLVVVGGPQGGTVEVTYRDGDGQVVTNRQVGLSDGQTTVLELPGAVRRVDLSPVAGSVYAGITVRGPGIDSLPVRGVVATVRQPNVTPVFH